MPIPAAVGQIFQITFNGQVANQVLMNTFHFRLDVVGAAQNVDQVADEINTKITAGTELFQKFLDCMPPEYLALSRWIQVMWPTRVRRKTYLSGLPGNYAGKANSPNFAVSIERHAETSGRSSVGRVQLLASDTPADITGGTITGAAYAAALDALALKMRSSISTAPSGHILNPVLWAKATQQTFRYVTGSFKQTTVRVMRRRTVGLGI